MNKEVIDAVLNLTAFHHEQYPGSDPVTVEKLESGDWSLTRTSPDGSVTFIEIIDKDTGEFISTAYPRVTADHLNPTD